MLLLVSTEYMRANSNTAPSEPVPTTTQSSAATHRIDDVTDILLRPPAAARGPVLRVRRLRGGAPRPPQRQHHILVRDIVHQDFQPPPLTRAVGITGRFVRCRRPPRAVP